MGKSNKALESKPQDDLDVIDMPADMKMATPFSVRMTNLKPWMPHSFI